MSDHLAVVFWQFSVQPVTLRVASEVSGRLAATPMQLSVLGHVQLCGGPHSCLVAVIVVCRNK